MNFQNQIGEMFSSQDFSKEDILQKGYRVLFKELGLSTVTFISELKKKSVSEAVGGKEENASVKEDTKMKKSFRNYYNYIYFSCLEIFRKNLSEKGIEILTKERDYALAEENYFPVIATAEEARNDLGSIAYIFIAVPKLYFELKDSESLKIVYQSIFNTFRIEAESYSGITVPVIFTDSVKILEFQKNIILIDKENNILKRMLLIGNLENAYNMQAYF